MNFAFSALLILFLVMPGIIFFYAYRSEHGRPAWTGTLADEVPIVLVLSTLLHAVWVCVANLIGQQLTEPLQVNFHAVVVLLGAQQVRDSELFDNAATAISDYPVPVFAYFVLLWCASAALGRVVKKLTEKYAWDRSITFLRWNDWYYLFNGYGPDGSPPSPNYEGSRVTAVMGEYVYWGILVDYVIDKNGQLDSVVIDGPKRRKLGDGEKPQDDLSSDSRPGTHSINADYLVLKYSECTNLAFLEIVATANEESETETGIGGFAAPKTLAGSDSGSDVMID